MTGEITAGADGALVRFLRRYGALVVTSYHSGVLIVLRARGGGLGLDLVSFPRPMGLAVDGNRLAVGSAGGRLHAFTAAGTSWRWRGETASACVDVHDVAFARDGLVVASTGTDQLVYFAGAEGRAWSPRWLPEAGADRIHLNGVALRRGQPAYVSCFTIEPGTGSWRDVAAGSGGILSLPTGIAIADGLHRPHSPRLSGGRLYYCESGRGLIHRDGDGPIAEVDGFARGLAFSPDGHLIVGISKLRSNHDVAGDAAGWSCGLRILHRDGRPAGRVDFDGIEEIYDVAMIYGRSRIELPPRQLRDPASLGEQLVDQVAVGGGETDPTMSPGRG